ncbi:MAG: holo-ACP synthase [Pseudomonadota bacterium]
MITGIGVDTTLVSRIEESLDRFGDRLVARVLHESERTEFESCRQPAQFLAKRFAIKEAAAKALGTGIREGVSLHDFVTEHDKLGKPLLSVGGVAAEMCAAQGINHFHVSLTDEADNVTAFAVFERID